MRKVICIEDSGYLKDFLKTVQSQENVKRRYLLLGTAAKFDLELLHKKQFQAIRPPVISQEYQKSFIQEYQRMIEQLGERNQYRRLWWATGIACKNPFTSLLPLLLEQFILVMQIIREGDYDQLAIISVDWDILPLLRKELKKERILVRYIGNAFQKQCQFYGHQLYKIGGVFYNGLRILRRRWYARRRLALPDDQRKEDTGYYVMKTFVYDRSFDAQGNYRDLFFGRLPEYLRMRDNLVIVANILENYEYYVQQMAKAIHQGQRIYPFELFLSLTDILKAGLDLCFKTIVIGRDVTFFGQDVSSIIKQVMVRHFKTIRFDHFVHYEAIKNLIKRIKITDFLLTYENYPWERMAIKALREDSPQTRIVGYQHTVVPQSYMNFFIGSIEKKLRLVPDRILTTGEKPKEIMLKYGDYQGIDVQPVWGLRFEHLFKHEGISLRSQPIKNILVALEGRIEAAPLIVYILEELGNDTHYQIKVRTHPLLPWEALTKALKIRKEDFSNLSVSEKASLQEDLQWADVVVYWSTTVALEALVQGKPVIHFNQGGILSYDPLFECLSLKWVATSDSSLVQLFKVIESMSDAAWDQEQKSAREYIKQYLYPVDQEGFAKFNHDFGIEGIGRVATFVEK